MIITKTPLRISFIGGGTDLPAYYENGYGAVVSTTINKYIYITLNKRFDDTIRLSYSQTENVDHVEDLKHEVLTTPDRVVVDLPFETAWHKLPSDVRDASTNAQGQIDDIEIRNVLGDVSAPILSDDDFIAMEFGLTI